MSSAATGLPRRQNYWKTRAVGQPEMDCRAACTGSQRFSPRHSGGTKWLQATRAQKSNLPEDIGPLPRGILVSAEVVGPEGPGQMAGNEAPTLPWKVQVVS